MATIPSASLLEQLRWRYATKKFDPTRVIDQATWSAIEQAAVLAPSSYGLQPWKFLVIKSPQLRAQLREVSWNQPQITDASHLMVFCRRANLDAAYVDRYIAAIAKERGVSAEALAGFRGMMVGGIAKPESLPGGSMDTYTRSQTYIALGFALYTAAMLGVDACPMEGFDAAKYDQVLGLSSQGLRASVVGAFGYRAADDSVAPEKAAKVRFAHGDVIEYR